MVRYAKYQLHSVTSTLQCDMVVSILYRKLFLLRYFAPAILALAERVEEAENVVAVLEPAKGAINGKGRHKALTEAVAENKRLREQIALHAGDCLLLQNEIDNLIAQDEPSAYLVSPPSVTFLRV